MNIVFFSMFLSILGCFSLSNPKSQESTNTTESNTTESNTTESNTAESKEQRILNKLQQLSTLSDPRDIHNFCFEHREPEVQNICKRYLQRSHLFDTTNTTTKKNTSTNTKTSSVCSDGNIECWEKYAHSAQTIEQATHFCSQISQSRWEQECYFTTAETWVQQSSQKYQLASELCKKSNSFFPKCVEHLTITVTHPEYTVEQAIAMADLISDSWNEQPHIQKQQLNIFWFTYLSMYRQQNKGMNTALYKKLPIESHPHITSFITHSLIFNTNKKMSLDQWKQEIETLLATEQHISYQPKNLHRIPSDYRKHTSCQDCILFFHHSVRPYSSDIKEDIELSIIAVLELSNPRPQ